MAIKIKKLYPEAKLPTKAHKKDVGWDLYIHSIEKITGIPSTEGNRFYNGILYKVGYGIAVESTEGTYVEIVPRSSVYKTGMILTNSTGIIDPDYRGELMSYMYYYDLGRDEPKVGDRIAQLVLRPYLATDIQEVDELSDTERGDRAFGSSGS